MPLHGRPDNWHGRARECKSYACCFFGGNSFRRGECRHRVIAARRPLTRMVRGAQLRCAPIQTTCRSHAVPAPVPRCSRIDVGGTSRGPSVSPNYPAVILRCVAADQPCHRRQCMERQLLLQARLTSMFRGELTVLPASAGRNLTTTLEEGRMRTCLLPRFSALVIVLRQSASTDIRTICETNEVIE